MEAGGLLIKKGNEIRYVLSCHGKYSAGCTSIEYIIIDLTNLSGKPPVLTMGRPLRIDLRDCDTVMPSSVDMLSDMTGLPEAVASAYIPTDLPRLADCWVTMIHLSKLLGDVLSLSYRPLGPHPSLQQVEATETEILLFQFPDNSDADRSRLATFYMYHLQLHYQFVLV
ncbi:unnamed protein product [Aspergillus oryzae]|nr:unnamed protein product [Aspergillus oryzae]